MMLTNEVKQLALKLGADKVGVTSAEALAKAPDGHKPADLLPGAKSVVVLAIHLPAGALATSNMRVLMNSSLYVEHKLNSIAHEITTFLEGQGFLAVPVHPDIPVDMQSKQAFLGDFSHKHAAVAAGIGEMGTSTLLLTPEFGPRVRLISVITSAPLESDKKLKQKVCRKCFTCVKECPAGAVSKDGSLDKIKCVRECMPYSVGSLVKFLRGFVEVEGKEAKLQMLRDPKILDFHQFLRVGRGIHCANCMKMCPAGQASKQATS